MTQTYRLCVFALVVFNVIACASDDAERRGAPAPLADATFTAPLTYEVTEAGGTRRVHVPLVRARVGGVETLLILDTGATDHVFTRDLAERIGLTLTPAEAGTDHAGAAVTSWSAAEDVTFEMAGRGFVAQTPVIIEGPPPFAGWNVGGFLSPQGIAADRTLVLDFAGQTITVRDALSVADQDALQTAHPGLVREALALVPASGDAARLLIVSAQTPANTPLRVMLNCGGKNAEFTHPLVEDRTRDAPAVATGRGVSGTAVMGQNASGGTLRLGGGAIALNDIVIREQGPDYDAQLGMPMLAGTVLVVPPRGAGTIDWWLPVPGALTPQ